MKIKVTQIQHFPTAKNVVVTLPMEDGTNVSLVTEENITLKELVETIERAKGLGKWQNR